MFYLEDMAWENCFSLLLVVYLVSILLLFSLEKKICCTCTSIHEYFDVIFDTYQLYMNYLTLLGWFL